MISSHRIYIPFCVVDRQLYTRPSGLIPIEPIYIYRTSKKVQYSTSWRSSRTADGWIVHRDPPRSRSIENDARQGTNQWIDRQGVLHPCTRSLRPLPPLPRPAAPRGGTSIGVSHGAIDPSRQADRASKNRERNGRQEQGQALASRSLSLVSLLLRPPQVGGRARGL